MNDDFLLGKLAAEAQKILYIFAVNATLSKKEATGRGLDLLKTILISKVGKLSFFFPFFFSDCKAIWLDLMDDLHRL